MDAESGVELVREALRYSSAVEQIIAAAKANRFTLELVAALADRDPELSPELETVAEHLTEALETLTRAADFIEARRDARLSAATNNLEGGTPT